MVASGCGVGHESQPLPADPEGCRPPRKLAVVRHDAVRSGESRARLRGWWIPSLVALAPRGEVESGSRLSPVLSYLRTRISKLIHARIARIERGGTQP